MSYLVLARKWRPQTFADIAGQSHIARTLQNAIRTNRIAHAYLFTGVRGVGKTTAARILAKALNCENGPTPDPCNRCTHCEEITAGTSLDVLEIDGASNRGIDEIRQIIENVRYQPANCRFKIYIIDEVHQVTKDAFNALLKTLEEPPPAVKFILATTEPHRLPETILSRCQRYDFRRIPASEIAQRLGEIAEKEGLKISPGALVLLAREADGSMRDAQSLLEQILARAVSADGAGGTLVDELLLKDVLGLTERKLLYDLSQAILGSDPRRCVELVGEAAFQGSDVCRLSRDLVEHCRNLLVARLLSDKRPQGGKSPQNDSRNQLLEIPESEVAELMAQVANVSVDTLVDYFDFMAAGDEEVARSPNPRFALETVLVRLATLPQSFPAAQILDRLEKLEQQFKTEPKPYPSAKKEAAPTMQIADGAPPPATFAATASSPPERRDPGVKPAEVIMAVSSASGEGDKVSRASAPPEQRWQEFVTFVGKEKKFLASHLESGTPLNLPPGQLRVGVSERHHLNYLQDAENLAALVGLARRFFSNDTISVAFTLAASEEAPKQPQAGPSAGTGGREHSEIVNEALRIFGGSVRSVRREDS
jgi:DNA polymerase-3 subunit gamma/tau